jgi:hypothetical protein
LRLPIGNDKSTLLANEAIQIQIILMTITSNLQSIWVMISGYYGRERMKEKCEREQLNMP